jgi:hypothetical protein
MAIQNCSALHPKSKIGILATVLKVVQLHFYDKKLKYLEYKVPSEPVGSL